MRSLSNPSPNSPAVLTLDSATIQPLLAGDNKNLRALVLAETTEGNEYVCLSLVDALCARSPAFLSALTAPAMLASLIMPETASRALALLEKLKPEVGEALSELIIAKDDKGKSKLLALLKKSLPRSTAGLPAAAEVSRRVGLAAGTAASAGTAAAWSAAAVASAAAMAAAATDSRPAAARGE